MSILEEDAAAQMAAAQAMQARRDAQMQARLRGKVDKHNPVAQVSDFRKKSSSAMPGGDSATLGSIWSQNQNAILEALLGG